MDKPFLLARAAVTRAMWLFDPPEPVRHRAAFASGQLADAVGDRDAGAHGLHRP